MEEVTEEVELTEEATEGVVKEEATEEVVMEEATDGEVMEEKGIPLSGLLQRYRLRMLPRLRHP